MKYVIALPGFNETIAFKNLEDGSFIQHAEIANAMIAGTAQFFNSDEFQPDFYELDEFEMMPENATIISYPDPNKMPVMDNTLRARFLN